MSINGMISIRACFFGMGDRILMALEDRRAATEPAYNLAPVKVQVIGMRTVGGVPGRKRAERMAVVLALSRMALPVLCPIVADVTEPLGLTWTTTTPLPVARARRASYGY